MSEQKDPVVEETTQQNDKASHSVTVSDPVSEAQAIQEMRNELNAIKAENAGLKEAKKKYYDSILNSQEVQEVAPEKKAADIRKEFFSKDKTEMSNLDYAKHMLELDEACIRETGESCFLPKGKNVTPSYDEKDVAMRLHNCLEECIEAADGDPRVFNSELERRIR